MRKKVIVLLSGGMDSVTALYDALENHEVVGALSFDYGSKHNHKEIPFAVLHCKKTNIIHRIVKMDFISELFKSDLLKSGGDIPEGHYEAESMKATVVPFRNGIMLAIACGYAESLEAEAVVIGAHSGDHAIYPDCRNDFMDAMSQAMQNGTYAKVELLAPFVDIDKTAILKKGIQLGLDYSLTWSCYKGNDLHCGKCGTCVERKEAFELAGVADPTIYS